MEASGAARKAVGAAYNNLANVVSVLNSAHGKLPPSKCVVQHNDASRVKPHVLVGFHPQRKVWVPASQALTGLCAVCGGRYTDKINSLLKLKKSSHCVS